MKKDYCVIDKLSSCNEIVYKIKNGVVGYNDEHRKYNYVDIIVEYGQNFLDTFKHLMTQDKKLLKFTKTKEYRDFISKYSSRDKRKICYEKEVVKAHYFFMVDDISTEASDDVKDKVFWYMDRNNIKMEYSTYYILLREMVKGEIDLYPNAKVYKRV